MQLSDKRFAEADYIRSHWQATVNHGTSPDDLKDPNYWAHVALKLKVGDRIDACAETGEWYAQLVVRKCDRISAVVGFIHLVEFNENVEPMEEDSEYEVMWAGQHHKWRIMRVADNEVVKHGFETREDARQGIREYLKALAA
jgi:hypothetical protein